MCVSMYACECVCLLVSEYNVLVCMYVSAFMSMYMC